MCPSVDYGGDGFLLGDGKLEAEAATCLRISEAVLREFSISLQRGATGSLGKGHRACRLCLHLEVRVPFSCPHFWLCDLGRLPDLSEFY